MGQDVRGLPVGRRARGRDEGGRQGVELRAYLATPGTEDALAELVVGLGLRDQSALATLYDLTFARVHALASAILRSAPDAEEVVCDTYSQAWADAGRYDRSRGSVLAWLLTMCRSRALDRLRQRRAGHVELEAAAELADDGPPPEDLLSLAQEGTRVHAALATLAPERRELVALAFLHGLSHPEIAERTGLPLGTVKSHVRRALTQLREVLGE